MAAVSATKVICVSRRRLAARIRRRAWQLSERDYARHVEELTKLVDKGRIRVDEIETWAPASFKAAESHG